MINGNCLDCVLCLIETYIKLRVVFISDAKHVEFTLIHLKKGSIKYMCFGFAIMMLHC